MLKEIYLSIVLAICLLFLTNPITRAQNLFISRLDEARNAMMPFYHGSAVYKSCKLTNSVYAYGHFEVHPARYFNTTKKFKLGAI